MNLNGTCHLAFGTAVGTAVVVNLNFVNQYFPNIPLTAEMGTLLVLGSIVGSLLPDVDNPTSYVGKLCYPISFVIGKIYKLQGKEEWQHRGILHDGAVYLAGLILSYFYFSPLVGLFLGCLTHIFLDMFNPAGVPFLLGVRRIKLGKFKSGEKGSKIFTAVCISVVLLAGTVCKVLVI